MTKSPIRWQWRALPATLLLFVAGAAAAAPGPTAVIGNLVGSGYVGTPNRPLANNMRLGPGDRIVLRTGKLTVRMDDGTVIKLAGPAEFTLENRDAAGRSLFTATSGRVFVTTRQRSGREVRVQTPSATLAVRGSSGGVESDERRGLFWCAEGLVYVDAAGERVLLTAGYQTEVLAGEPPSDPVPMAEETQALNEALNLEASLHQSLEGTSAAALGGPTRAPGRLSADQAPPTDAEVAAQAVAAAQEVLNQLYTAYENEDLGGVLNLLGANFTTSQAAGATSNAANIQESFRHDFANLDNIRFFRQTGASARYSRDTDQVSIRERWIVGAVLASGARLQQGGQTLFTIGPDAGSGGLRVLRWEGDTPFGRYSPDGAEMTIAAPTLLIPPAPGAPEVSLTRGTLAAGAATLSNTDARFLTSGVTVTAREVNVNAAGGLSAGSVAFTLNGVAFTGESLTVLSENRFQVSDVRASVAGAQLNAQTLDVAGGTLQLQDVTVTTVSGATASLDTATVHPPQEGNPPFITGTTADQQPVTIAGGEMEVEIPPAAPLAAGRGEVLTNGQGFAFATESVTQNPADLFFTEGTAGGAGLLMAPGIQDLGAVSFDAVVSAPESGYRDRVTVDASLAGHVLVLQTESGKYAKLLVRAGTSNERLVFDWVYNPHGGTTLTRARRYPTRAAIAYNAKVYNRSVGGNSSSLLAEGT
ncbi:MAG: FecR family protein, partial [Armatimonadota bacterium]|nr:FecR family protein [Armatimonadota bacterium]